MPSRTSKRARPVDDLATEGNAAEGEAKVARARKAQRTVPAIAPPPKRPISDAKRLRIVVLLRAVNVSGANRVPMATLTEICASATVGGRAVETYLQSGNVAFTCETTPSAAAQAVSDALDEDLGLSITCFAREQAELDDLVAKCPYNTGDPTKVHVAFLETVPTEEALARLAARERGEDRFEVNGRHLYLSYPNGAGRAKLSSAHIEKALGVPMTSRNWRTVLKLAEMARSPSK